ncbi:vitamin K epoxide reductase family protein [Devriesea agamarum]|uniref:vitamin K epoxide reductase family protein n=1 Tax=Devriesea agamarum TaxID=472569 RepID=UPI00071DD58B|nr:vitamin K epoxide reductase family protein [Devriesea agamarum]
MTDLETPDDDALRAEIDAEIRARHQRINPRVAGVILLIFSTISWVLALVLSIDKIRMLENPGTHLGCDINPFISCGSVMMTPEASIFGFPNMFLGLAGYAILGTAGLLLAAGANLPRWFERAILIGLVLAFGFVHFLIIDAVFIIHMLCPNCLGVWAATAPMFFVYLAYSVNSGLVPAGGVIRRLTSHWISLTVIWYALVLCLLFFGFLPSWLSMLGV